MEDADSSYLSPYVRQTWATFADTSRRPQSMDVDDALKNGLFIDAGCVAKFLINLDSSLNNSGVAGATAECLAAKAPLVHAVFRTYSALNDVSSLAEYLRWTSNEEVFLQSLTNLQRHDRCVTDVALVILRCTAALERALGNVFLVHGEQVPWLIKDLLSSNELNFVFGADLMNLLQVVMGSPFSVNIRNVVWHGFAKPEEIPPKIAYFVIALTTTLGQVLKVKNIDIPCRAFVEIDWSAFLTFNLVDLRKERNLAILKATFVRSRFIPDGMLPYWIEALKQFELSRYGFVLYLILPQLEHSLRILFAKLNKCPVRAMTAETAELYTTFNEILSEFVSYEKRNRLLDFIGENGIVALLDLLVFPDGPRLRDRLSHGEMCVETIPHYVAAHLLTLGAYFASMCDCKTTDYNFTELIGLSNVYRNYRSRYHLFDMVSSMVSTLSTMTSDSNWKRHVTEDGGHFESTRMRLVETLSTLPNNRHIIVKLFDSDVDASVDSLSQLLAEIRYSVLHRPLVELEMVRCLRRLLANLIVVVGQVDDYFVAKTALFEGHELRSRQRLTYSRMINCLPWILLLTRVSSVAGCTCLAGLNGCEKWKKEKLELEKRFLRKFEQMSDSLKRTTDQRLNRWDESLSAIRAFIIETFLPHFTRSVDESAVDDGRG